jgi:hypothetical protein
VADPSVPAAPFVRRGDPGVSLIELLFAVSILITLAIIALPQLLSGLDDVRAGMAGRYVAHRMGLARLEAVKRSTSVGFRFESTGDGYRYACYVDGNGNGVRTADIRSGADPMLGEAERIEDRFAGVRFELGDGIPDVDGTVAGGARAVRFGSAGILTFTPLGTASSGTVYIRSRTGAQFAVRVLGGTARTRVLHFDTGTRKWVTR